MGRLESSTVWALKESSLRKIQASHWLTVYLGRRMIKQCIILTRGREKFTPMILKHQRGTSPIEGFWSNLTKLLKDYLTVMQSIRMEICGLLCFSVEELSESMARPGKSFK